MSEIFYDLDKAKQYAKENAPKVILVWDKQYRIGNVSILTPIGRVDVCVSLAEENTRAVSISEIEKPKKNIRAPVKIFFKDASGRRRSQRHLQSLIDSSASHG